MSNRLNIYYSTCFQHRLGETSITTLLMTRSRIRLPSQRICFTGILRTSIRFTEKGKLKWIIIMPRISAALVTHVQWRAQTHTQTRQWIIGSNQVPHNRIYCPFPKGHWLERWAPAGQSNAAEIFVNQSTHKSRVYTVRGLKTSLAPNIHWYWFEYLLSIWVQTHTQMFFECVPI